MTSGFLRAGRPTTAADGLTGTHLGLVLAEEASRRHSLFLSPRFRVHPLLDIDRGDVARAAQVFGSGVSVRYSGLREAFSPHAARGIQRCGVRLGHAEALACSEQLVDQVLARAPLGTTSIVLQELWPMDGMLQRVIAYTESDTVLIEVHRPDGSTRLSRIERDGCTLVEETSPSVDPLEHSLDAALPAALRNLAEDHDFDLDIEGFWDGSRFILLQLRPIPADRPVRGVGYEIAARSEGDGYRSHVTLFGWGCFSAEGWVSSWDDCVDEALLRLVEGHRWMSDCLPLVPDDGTTPVLIDVRRGFRLEHSTAFLPRNLEARNRFRYVSAATWQRRHDIRPGTRLAASNDGHHAHLMILDATAPSGNGIS